MPDAHPLLERIPLRLGIVENSVLEAYHHLAEEVVASLSKEKEEICVLAPLILAYLAGMNSQTYPSATR